LHGGASDIRVEAAGFESFGTADGADFADFCIVDLFGGDFFFDAEER
jgi:hypothetical protein